MVKMGFMVVLLMVLLIGCGRSGIINNAGEWRSYQNPRYKFEFLYPSDWVKVDIPGNGDGQAFSPSDNDLIQIRGAGSLRLPTGGMVKLPVNNATIVPFQTDQGVMSELKVILGIKISSMVLTISTKEVIFVWEGRTPSQDFAEYYRLFYFIASRFRIPDGLILTRNPLVKLIS